MRTDSIALARAHERERQQVVGEARVDARREARRAALAAGRLEPVDHLLHRVVAAPRVDERHDRASTRRSCPAARIRQMSSSASLGRRSAVAV